MILDIKISTDVFLFSWVSEKYLSSDLFDSRLLYGGLLKFESLVCVVFVGYVLIDELW